MPIMRIDMIKGRTQEEVKKILDISYDVMLRAFEAPEGDRYQIVTQHESYEMEILDTGLGIQRTNEILIFSLTTRYRTVEQKKKFYSILAKKLHEEIGIRVEDIMVNLVVNSDEDWSFFSGEAQFLNGDLT